MDEPKRIPTNLRMLMILEIVGQSDIPLSATEINDQLGLPKQTAHRLVSTLEGEGFLMRDSSGKKFRSARRARNMGFGLLFTSRFHILRHQILQELALNVRESVNFVVPQETGMHYLDRVETDWPFRVQLPRGSNVPFHCTASGKAFLASLPRPARRKFVQGLTLSAQTKNTITDPQEFLQELEQVAIQGYALDAEEFIDDMVAIAVPVTTADNRYIASLATHGPKQRIDLDRARGFHGVLEDAALKLREAILD